MLKKILTNRVLQYVFSRYLTYFIQFVNSIFIAVYLGPFYLGIWGFINLILHYLDQTNFGISHSVNAIISVHKNKTFYVTRVIGTATSMIMMLSVLVIALYFISIIFDFQIGYRYGFSSYAPLVIVIAVFNYFNGLFSNILRVYGRIFEIAFTQSSIPVLTLIVILIFKSGNLLWALIFANCFAMVLSFLLLIARSPIKIKPLLIWRLVRKVQQRGWHLFLYNSSFYFIIISTRTFISGYYTVTEFGYFTFSFTLANAIFLILQSFSYLIFPKLLNRFAYSSNEKVVELLDRLRISYITSSHALVHIAILLFPLVIHFLPQYEPASYSFMIIALTKVLYTNSFGYQGFLIARGKEKRLGQLAFAGLLINIVFAYLLIEFLVVPFSMVIASTTVSYFIQVYFICSKGRGMMNLKTSFPNVFKDMFPIRLFLPYIFSLVLILISADSFYFVIPVALFLILNIRILLKIKEIVKSVISNPQFINI